MNGKWTVRPIVGAMGTLGPRRLWMREVRDLVENAPLTPFVRVAVAADFASPFANAGDQGLGYINSDVTLYLHRLPLQEWIGFEVVNHHATDGVAIGECFLYDQQGPIGSPAIRQDPAALRLEFSRPVGFCSFASAPSATSAQLWALFQSRPRMV